MKIGKTVLILSFAACAASFLIQASVRVPAPNPDHTLQFEQDSMEKQRMSPPPLHIAADGKAVLFFPFDTIEKLTLNVPGLDVLIDPALKGIEITGDPALIPHLSVYWDRRHLVELRMPSTYPQATSDSLFRIDNLLRRTATQIRVGLCQNTALSCRQLQATAPLHAEELQFRLEEVDKADLPLDVNLLELFMGVNYMDTVKTDTIGRVILRGQAEALNIGFGHKAKIDARALQLRDAYLYNLSNSIVSLAPTDIFNTCGISNCTVDLYSKPRYRRNLLYCTPHRPNDTEVVPSRIVER